MAPPLGGIPGLTRRPSPRRFHGPEEGPWTDILIVGAGTQAQGGPMTCRGHALKAGAQLLGSHYPLCLHIWTSLGGSQEGGESRVARCTDRNGLRGSGKLADPPRGCERRGPPVLPAHHASSGLCLEAHLHESCSPRAVAGGAWVSSPPPPTPTPAVSPDFAWPLPFNADTSLPSLDGRSRPQS